MCMLALFDHIRPLENLFLLLEQGQQYTTDGNEPSTVSQLCNMAVRYITQGRCYVLDLCEYHAPNKNIKTYAHAEAYFL